MILENLLLVPQQKEDEIIYSGYFINKSPEELQNWISKQFTSSSDIKSLKRKRAIQLILEKFSKYFETLLDGKYSLQFFVGEDFSHFFVLDKFQLDIIKKYHKKEEFLMEENTYDWADFYFNDKFISVYEADKEVLQHYYFTKTKFEERDRVKIDYLKDYLIKFPPCFFVENSKSKILEKLSPQVQLENGRNKHEQFIKTKEEMDLQKSVKKLEQQWVEIEKNPDKYVFGNEIIRSIQNYEIKEIYCYEEFKDKLESKLPKELFNFVWNVYPKDRDIFSINRLGDYRGIFGLKYY